MTEQKRSWQEPQVRSIDDLAVALGVCQAGSTPTTTRQCTTGNQANAGPGCTTGNQAGPGKNKCAVGNGAR